MKKMLKVLLMILGVIVLFIAGLIFLSKAYLKDIIHPVPNLTITSSAFSDGGMMPVQYTGKGEDINPPLVLEGISPEAKSIAVIMDDLDTPIGVFNHWIIWNIPAEFIHIPEAIPKGKVVESLGNAIHGKSQYGGKHYYRGPLPPFGVHRYVFKVYVLDTVLELDHNAGKIKLQKAMDGHILQYGTLTGRFGAE